MIEPLLPQTKVTDAAAADVQPPFTLALKLADATLVRAQKAEALKKAVEVLREKLTSEQLTKVAATEVHLLPPRHGPPPLPQFAPLRLQELTDIGRRGRSRMVPEAETPGAGSLTLSAPKSSICNCARWTRDTG